MLCRGLTERCWSVARVAGDAKRHMQTVTTVRAPCSAPICPSLFLFIFFYLFSCAAPIPGALNARAAPLRSAGTVFCLLFPPNGEISRSRACPAIGWIDLVRLLYRSVTYLPVRSIIILKKSIICFYVATLNLLLLHLERTAPLYELDHTSMGWNLSRR